MPTTIHNPCAYGKKSYEVGARDTANKVQEGMFLEKYVTLDALMEDFNCQCRAVPAFMQATF